MAQAKEFATIPCYFKEVEKAGKKRMIVRMLATTDRKDLQGQRVKQDGVDWDYWTEHGDIEETDHQKNIAGRVGVSRGVVAKNIEVKPGVHGTIVEGELLDTPEGRDIFKVGVESQRLGRALRASIRGPVYELQDENGNITSTGAACLNDKRGNVLSKTQVRAVAITRHAVEPGTWAQFMEKSLDAGYQTPVSGGGSGAPLMPQSVDSRVMIVTPDNPRRKAMKRYCKDGKPLSDDEMKEAMKAAGLTEEEETEGAAAADGEAEKKEAEAAALLKQAEAEEKGKKLAETRKSLEPQFEAMAEHAANGGWFTIVKHTPGVTPDSAEGLAECAKSLGIDTEPAPAAFDGAEMQKALDARLDTAKAEYAEAVKALGTQIEGHMAAIERQIEKSLKVPAQPRDVKPVEVSRMGAPIGKNVAANLEMRKSLMVKFSAAETSKSDKELAGELIKMADSAQLLPTDGLRRLNIIPAA